FQRPVLRFLDRLQLLGGLVGVQCGGGMAAQLCHKGRVTLRFLREQLFHLLVVLVLLPRDFAGHGENLVEGGLLDIRLDRRRVLIEHRRVELLRLSFRKLAFQLLPLAPFRDECGLGNLDFLGFDRWRRGLRRGFLLLYLALFRLRLCFRLGDFGGFHLRHFLGLLNLAGVRSVENFPQIASHCLLLRPFRGRHALARSPATGTKKARRSEPRNCLPAVVRPQSGAQEPQSLLEAVPRWRSSGLRQPIPRPGQSSSRPRSLSWPPSPRRRAPEAGRAAAWPSPATAA